MSEEKEPPKEQEIEAEEPAAVSADTEQTKSIRYQDILRPGINILRYGYGIVDVVFRTAVAAFAFIVFVIGLVVNIDRVVIFFGWNSLGGWAAFVGFVLMVIEVSFIIFRFLNFAITFEMPLVIMLVDTISIGIGILGVFPTFIAASVYSANLHATFLGNLSSSKTDMAALAAFSFFLLVVLLVLIVYSILWYVMKWFKYLESNYIPSDEETA